jgi:flavin-dependent dehydrogenase
LPGIIPILDDIGVLPEIESAGFGRKTGSTLWGWGRTPRWDLWFADSDAYDAAWLVERARFDAMLFDHAKGSGAEVIDRASVRELEWTGDRATGVQWTHGGETHVTRAPLVVDASGAAALIGRRHGSREQIPGLRHQAMWAHFEHAGRLPPPRAAQALFVATAEQWWWMFPLDERLTSVGVVQLDAGSTGLREGGGADPARPRPRRADFDAELAKVGELVAVLGPHARRTSEVRNERDWSYRMRDVAGPGWLAVGDAAGFIDPVLSTGVMLAMHSGWHAARTAASIVRGDDEADALQRYRTHHRSMFEDLLRMVRFYYQQNLEAGDYFWESKRILLAEDNALRPQKAFVILTSGLVQNLALADRVASARRRDDDRITGNALDLEGADPDELGFVCLHLRRGGAPTHDGPDEGTSIYVVVEPADAAAPTLLRTRNFHVNAIAPKHGNDPISVPDLAPTIRRVLDGIAKRDVQPDDSLAAWWRRERAGLAVMLAEDPHGFALVRAFGE